MEKSREWEMIQNLMEELDDIEIPNQINFILNLFDHLDPHLPFLEQQSEKQLEYLELLHGIYVSGKEED